MWDETVQQEYQNTWCSIFKMGIEQGVFVKFRYVQIEHLGLFWGTNNGELFFQYELCIFSQFQPTSNKMILY